MAEALLITRNDLVRLTALNGNVDTDKFIQFIKIAQDIHIEHYLGTQLIEKIKTLILNGDINDPVFEDYKGLLEVYVKPMLIYWAMVEYLPNAAYTIANKGVYKHSSENAENVDKIEIDFLINKYSDIAKEYTERFISHIIYNQDKFPEYNTNSNGDTFPNDITNYGGWILQNMKTYKPKKENINKLLVYLKKLDGKDKDIATNGKGC